MENNLLPFAALLLLALSLLSVWVRRDPKVWGTLLGLSLILGLISGLLLWIGVLITLAWAALWFWYMKQKQRTAQIILLAVILLLSYGFKFHRFPGFEPLIITPKFFIGFAAPLVGLFPLALLVPIAKRAKEWKIIFGKGLVISCMGIAILALLAFVSGVVHWQFKLPPFAGLRFGSNLLLTAIPEEAFYRGFLQRELVRFFPNGKTGKWLALLLSTLFFTLAHLYWSPNLGTLGFVFLASLLYGFVYLKTDKIESSILCHFLLNFIHMTCFSYHRL